MPRTKRRGLTSRTLKERVLKKESSINVGTGFVTDQPDLPRVCVFCDSKTGHNEQYRQAAAELGGLLVDRGFGLVFGGGSVGLMGVVADAVLERGGQVTGVLPKRLASKELRHPAVADMHIVDSMHARQALMACPPSGRAGPRTVQDRTRTEPPAANDRPHVKVLLAEQDLSATVQYVGQK